MEHENKIKTDLECAVRLSHAQYASARDNTDSRIEKVGISALYMLAYPICILDMYNIVKSPRHAQSTPQQVYDEMLPQFQNYGAKPVNIKS